MITQFINATFINFSNVKAASSAPVTNIGERTLLTLAMLAIIALSFLGMRRGWRNKSKREVAPIKTQIPAGATKVTEKVQARFAGTTTTGNWLDRITNYELGTPRGIQLQIFDQGIYLSDELNFNLWIPKSDIQSVGTKRGIAGDVVDKAGMIIFNWLLGDLSVDTGVRVARHADHELIVKALQSFPSASATQESMGAGA